MAYGDITRLNTNTAQLAATTGTLYTAPTAKKAQIGSILLHNTNTFSATTVEIFDNATSTSARILYVTVGPLETYEFSPKVPLALAGAETLEGKATLAAETNIKIYGREEN